MRRPQQQQRQAGIDGDEMQFLAGLQIELIDYADDGLRRARTQAFDQRPQRVLPMRGINDDRAVRIETETVKAMSGDMTGEMDWRDEDNFFLPPMWM